MREGDDPFFLNFEPSRFGRWLSSSSRLDEEVIRYYRQEFLPLPLSDIQSWLANGDYARDVDLVRYMLAMNLRVPPL